VKFSVGQNVAVTPDAAVAAYGTPAFYENGRPTGDITIVDVVGHEDSGERTRIEVRYKFTGSVSSAVRAVIDPAKISWITRTDIDKVGRAATFTVLPDNYADRLDCSGTFLFTEGATGPASCVVTVAGDLRVHVMLVGKTVEQIIVSGLRAYLTAEIETLPDFTKDG
jgi:hypothetical protein